MSATPDKDFGPIAADYVFFETHATEAEEDARAYARHLAGTAPASGPIRMLDFGCGSGTFTLRLFELLRWPPERLRLTLIEPVETVRRLAATRLASFSGSPIVDAAALPADQAERFDVILANHVFYYVPDLQGQLARLLEVLDPAGIFLTAVAGRANALIAIWIEAFRLLGREVPYHTAEDVEAVLQDRRADYRKEEVGYELTFPDTEENRLTILRFLLADHLPQLPLRPLLAQFDQYHRAGQIAIRTASDHYTIRARQGSH